jgi:diacylglycerol diphosphate phosphatase/phosphatidate phosphatase
MWLTQKPASAYNHQDRCRPPVDSSNPPLGLSTSAICTRTDLLKDGFRSFPSGHASLSACGMVYLALYLAGKMKVWDSKGVSLKSWILLAPLSVAALVAISRSVPAFVARLHRHHSIRPIALHADSHPSPFRMADSLCDYRHHPTDVLAGSALGTAIASYTYRLYYRPITGPRAGRPYSPRVARESSTTADGDGDSDVDEEARLSGPPGLKAGARSSVEDDEVGVESVELQRSLLAPGKWEQEPQAPQAGLP